MRLLQLSAYFAPEKMASSHIIDDLCQAYAQEGIHCICITPQPTRGVTDEVRNQYKKTEKMYEGFLTVKRFPMMKEGKNVFFRAMRYFLSAQKTYCNAVKEEDIDAIFINSTPPIMGMIAVKVAQKLSKKYGKNVPVIFNLQDIFPDSLVSAGIAPRDGILWKIGRRIEDYTYTSVDSIIVISEGFKKNIMAKGVPEDKIKVVSNWIDIDAVKPVVREDNKLFDEFGLERGKFTVVYAGNFGAVQGAEIVLETAEALKDNEDIQFVIFGGGANFDDAKKIAANLKNVFIHELLPLERVSEVYSMGDISLITCKKGTGNSGLPSKTWSIMACNTPIVASFDLDSDLAGILEDSKAGICVEPGNCKAVADAIMRFYERKSQIEKSDLRSYVEKHASKSMCTDAYIAEIKKFGLK